MKKRQVIRYYIIATAIVVIFGSIVFAHRLGPPNLRISARPSGTPTVETHHAAAPSTAPPFRARVRGYFRRCRTASTSKRA
jgi:hypothetical protein